MAACQHHFSPASNEPVALDGAEVIIAGLRREIADLEAELSRADRLATLGAMSGAVAHEINNLLTPLLSYAGFALANPEDGELGRRALQKTMQTAERARDVVDSLLRTVRLPDERQGETHCVVRTTVEDAISMMVRPPEASGIELILDVPEDLVAAISPAALQHALLNLLLNACEAMQPGPGSIIVTASKCKQNANSKAQGRSGLLELRVIDTGPGVDPDMLDRVFEPLISSKRPAHRVEQQGGSGLGLTVCKRLVEQAGGSIALRSQRGVGSCFAITLPLVSRQTEIRSAA
ncbi:MAG: HAMP domain-containing histidine kinase [bacterium]|nr:HAMP domain-containing histidine kinase [bacterium]